MIQLILCGINFHIVFYRTYLSAIHYNENSENQQATTRAGIARYTPVYPKKSRGECVVIKPVKVDPTFGKYFLIKCKNIIQ